MLKKKNKQKQNLPTNQPTKLFFPSAISGQKEAGLQQAQSVVSNALAFNYFPTIATACLVTSLEIKVETVTGKHTLKTRAILVS